MYRRLRLYRLYHHRAAPFDPALRFRSWRRSRTAVAPSPLLVAPKLVLACRPFDRRSVSVAGAAHQADPDHVRRGGDLVCRRSKDRSRRLRRAVPMPRRDPFRLYRLLERVEEQRASRGAFYGRVRGSLRIWVALLVVRGVGQ